MQERFGADILDQLAAAGAVEQAVKADGGRLIKYMLTKEVCAQGAACCVLCPKSTRERDALCVVCTGGHKMWCWLTLRIPESDHVCMCCGRRWRSE